MENKICKCLDNRRQNREGKKAKRKNPAPWFLLLVTFYGLLSLKTYENKIKKNRNRIMRDK
jgi:hypothetical protein